MWFHKAFLAQDKQILQWLIHREEHSTELEWHSFTEKLNSPLHKRELQGFTSTRSNEKRLKYLRYLNH